MDYIGISNDTLLDMLDTERHKFTQSDKVVMDDMIHELLRRGVYPALPVGNPNTVYQMVGGWGARWHCWSGPLTCPHCGTDLRNHTTGAPFKREVGLYANDRTYAYRCPDCNGKWPR